MDREVEESDEGKNKKKREGNTGTKRREGEVEKGNERN